MNGYIVNIDDLTLQNNNFRTVLYTSKNTQLVVMSLLPQEEIGNETHDMNDQFFRVESGQGKLIIDGVSHEFKEGFAFVIPAGAKHNVINTSTDKKLKLYTLYSPAHHKDQTVHIKKQDALADDEHFDGITSE